MAMQDRLAQGDGTPLTGVALKEPVAGVGSASGTLGAYALASLLILVTVSGLLAAYIMLR
ncbi:MAG: hypothetical protein PVSMB4_20340 [Ktedonobacterales bacterium]